MGQMKANLMLVYTVATENVINLSNQLSPLSQSLGVGKKQQNFYRYLYLYLVLFM
jgi:hypothetical protein